MIPKLIAPKSRANVTPQTGQFTPRPFAPKGQAKIESAAAPLIPQFVQNRPVLSRLMNPESVTPTFPLESAELSSDIPENQGNLGERIHRKIQGVNRLEKGSGMPPGPPSPLRFSIQPKLTVGAVGDRYEQEADRVARQVVNQIHAPRVIAHSSEPTPVQRKISVQTSGEGGAVSQEWEGELSQARTGGNPLAAEVKGPMEQGFGADFSGVRVHTDGRADRLARSIQAKAFTTGEDLFFRQGAYQPGSRGGQELIAHELTHVVQQSGGKVYRSPQASASSALNNPTTTSPRYPITVGISGSLQALQRAFDANNPSSYDNDGGHGYGDHGAQTTAEQHKERLKTGKTPSGRMADIPESSSKFASDAVMKTAIAKAVIDAAKDSVSKGKKKSKKRITLAYNIPGAGISYKLDPSGNDQVLATSVDWVVIVLEQTGTGKWDKDYDKIITLFPQASPPKEYDNKTP